MYYQILVYGRNFLLAWEDGDSGAAQLTGFYTTRFVTAADPADAEYQAMASIRADQALRAALRNPRTDPPIMVAEEIEELASLPPEAPGTGYAFFHGRGAGRPRDIALAAFADDAPADIREAATRRYGAPAGTAPPHRSSPPNKKKSGA